MNASMNWFLWQTAWKVLKALQVGT